MLEFKPTFAFKSYRVRKTEVTGKLDLALLKVSLTEVRHPANTLDLVFALSPDDPSIRLVYFVRACGASIELDAADHLIGRCLAINNGGRTVNDFATLEYAHQCFQCDLGAWRRSQQYLAEEYGVVAS